MKDGLTWYRIYRRFCNELNIIFPLKQSELSPRMNPIPNNLEFHKRNASKREISDNLNDISKVYYKIYRSLGEEKFHYCEDKNPLFSEHCMEFPDRRINLSTVISVLYMSGYRGDTLLDKSYKYYTKGSYSDD